MEDWQKDIIRSAFGWYEHETGNRRYSTIYIELPKGNGKSYLLSALSLYVTFGEKQMKAEGYVCAGDREQARIIHDTCKEIIENSPFLAEKFDSFKDSIVHNASKSFLKVISAEAYSKHGYRPYLIAMDEAHVQPNDELYETLKRGMIKRENSMMWVVTTAGVKNTFAETLHDYALNVQNGIIEDDSWLPIVYCADDKDEPFDPETWYKANPGLGTIINFKQFQKLSIEAENSPSKLNSFKRLHLNIWTGAKSSFIPLHIWEKADLGQVEEEYLSHFPCWGGLDLVTTGGDLVAFGILWEIEKDEKYVLKVWFWCAEATIERRRLKENVKYDSWVRQGHIFAQPGNVIDQRPIKEFILEKHAIHNFSLGYDRYNSTQLAGELYSDHDVEVREIYQGPTLSEAIDWLENMIKAEKLNHMGNPVLRWQIDNVQIKVDDKDRRTIKKLNHKSKIDGIVTAVFCIKEMILSRLEEEEGLNANNVVGWV